MRKLIACGVIALAGCAGGNYQLKGKNKAAPPQQVSQTPNQEVPQENTAKYLFPWVLWGTIILGCAWVLIKERSSSSEANDK